MRKVLILLAVILFLVVSAFVIFIATFDIERYKPFLVEKLETVTGSPVSLEHVSLAWRGGIAVELKGLGIYAGKDAAGEPALKIDIASAEMELMPLLRRELQVGSITLVRPRMTVLRLADGTVKVIGLNIGGEGVPKEPGKTAEAQSSGKGKAPAAVSLFVRSVKIEEGELNFNDQSLQPPLYLPVRKLDATLRNVSLNRPMRFDMRLALFSESQNIDASGTLTAPGADGPGRIEDFLVNIDADKLNSADLMNSVPAVRPLELNERGLAGQFSVQIEQLPLDPRGLRDMVSRIRLRNGKIVFNQVQGMLENLNLEATALKDSVELTGLSARFGGGMIDIKGAAKNLSAQPETAIEAAVKGLSLEQVFPAKGREEPSIHGSLSLSFTGNGYGLAGRQLAQTFSGQGRLTVQEPVIVNMNILNEVFQRFNMLPGLVDRLKSRLPPEYHEKFRERDTVLAPIDVPVSIRNEQLFFNNLELATDTFQLIGAGQVGFDGALSCQAMLRIEPAMSEAFVRSVEELQYLMNNQGVLEIPVRIQGSARRVQVLPDVGYITSRLAVVKTQEVLENLFQRRQNAAESSPQESQAPAP